MKKSTGNKKQCPKCFEMNPADSMFCTKCHTDISNEPLFEISDEDKKKSKRFIIGSISVGICALILIAALLGVNSKDRPAYDVTTTSAEEFVADYESSETNYSEETEIPTEAISEEETELETEKHDSVPLEYINALNKAKNYLEYSNFSKEGLRGQLEYEKFTDKAVNYAIENINADWEKQALGKAASYLESSAFSKERLYDQLIYEKFTENEARYGVDNIKANWNDQAVKKAQSYLKSSSFSKEKLYDQLIYEKFTADQAQYAVNKVYK